MRDLRERYRDDPRVLAAAAALAGDRETVLGACHGGIIPVMLAALCARGDTDPHCTYCNNA